MSVIVETSLGDFTIDLFTEERPKCCKNFLKLCKVKYYNFCLFHSVQRNFIAQTGDPTGSGKGGESINGVLYGDQARYFDWEFVPKIKHVKSGLVSMVNNGNNMHGSQFFITLADSLDYLDGVHTVFGEVTEGSEIITKLNEAYCDETFRPFRDIRIHHTIILDDPFEDPPGLEVPDRSPSPTPEVIERARLAADAEIDDMEGKTEDEIREIMEEREEKANAQILEMIGDLPSTDITAPENVLFVCKLNSVTTDEDLEIIFSRFGPIKSCEVIRDHKTGESLQYAFIEFEKKEDCESAYFKMDNVLIDDRRIHVDFSQSVSKIKWKGKGKGVETFKDEPKKPKYIIKDKSQRQDNNYDLVFEENGSSKSSKKKHKERSHDIEDNYRSKQKHNYRGRSRSPDRKRYKSPGRERKEERGRREEMHRSEKHRFSHSPRHRDDRHSPQRYRDDRHSPPPRYRDNRYLSPPRHREGRHVSPSRHREGRHVSPPRHRNDSYSPALKERIRDKAKKSPVRENDSHERGRKKGKKYESSDDESLERQESKKKKTQKKNSDDESMGRHKGKSVRKSGYSSDESLERHKSKKRNKYADSSSDEEIKTKKIKNKSSDENVKVHKKAKKKKEEFSDDENVKKKKKKKKKHDSSSDESVEETHAKKMKRSYSGDRGMNRMDSESPDYKKSDKHSADNFKSHSREENREKKKHRDLEGGRENDRRKESYKDKRR